MNKSIERHRYHKLSGSKVSDMVHSSGLEKCLNCMILVIKVEHFYCRFLHRGNV